jgi:hypothetical protein
MIPEIISRSGACFIFEINDNQYKAIVSCGMSVALFCNSKLISKIPRDDPFLIKEICDTALIVARKHEEILYKQNQKERVKVVGEMDFVAIENEVFSARETN